MSATIKCDVPRCTYTATHAREAYAKAMVGRHKRFAHGIAGKKYVKKSERVGNCQDAPAPQPTPERVSPNFCPNCGCNLAAVTAALNLRRRA